MQVNHVQLMMTEAVMQLMVQNATVEEYVKCGLRASLVCML